jgi:acetyltransferase-like isoleucine patch superfamily enzyme
MLIIAPTARISPLADLEDSVKGSEIRIEDGVVIDSFVKLKPAGGTGNVRIGRNCSINSGVVIYIGNGVMIGDDVAIGANTTLAPTNHAYMDRSNPIREQRFLPSRGGIVIEDDVWIGANCVLLDGAILRKGCVVGAGSLVRHELPAYSVNHGTPARTVSYRK